MWALGRARDELIGWIEGELAKVPEADGETDDDGRLGATGGQLENDPVPSNEQIDAAYEHYLESRRALLKTMASIPSLDLPTEQPPPQPLSQLPQPSTKPAPLQSHHILPHLPALLSCVDDERDLMQQTAYLRRRLAAGADENAKIVDRLAGESYLLQDANAMEISMASWAEASAAKREELERFLDENFRAGESGLRNAEEVLRRMEGRKQAWEEIKGDV
ncbi:hypothetical protein P152DRAFT_460376 [Eremomyces bilateralis CBS 781.70]|uniref:Uncharacterized protein n=1 Tax=Eremomyces bilateralis CBS 781.70 TaxID=1392243 RepID=A0A6G1FY34_9PEZI|nr:uncharacterized protein P152DRAFT_460376 [Eremomyces bilateralis CBS 781.70]KAF1810684.1 hypothetical protein P152DRAFT_460376 [Eremomyces bilateralis CBS 781.70]